MDLSRILDRMKTDGAISDIRRNKFDISMDEAMAAIKEIGRMITPRFVIDENNRFVYENLIKYVHCDPSCVCIDPETKEKRPADLFRKGIFICGECGTGKSVAMKVAAIYANAIGARVMVFDYREQKNVECGLFGMQIRVDQVCDEYANNGNIQRYKQAHILTVDDLGAEQGETLYMGNRQNVMRQIIEFRADRTNALTSFTSNAPMLHKFMIDKYGDRAVSRFKQMENYYELRGKDRRQ